jgi:hypothetical protein
MPILTEKQRQLTSKFPAELTADHLNALREHREKLGENPKPDAILAELERSYRRGWMDCLRWLATRGLTRKEVEKAAEVAAELYCANKDSKQFFVDQIERRLKPIKRSVKRELEQQDMPW